MACVLCLDVAIEECDAIEAASGEVLDPNDLATENCTHEVAA